MIAWKHFFLPYAPVYATSLNNYKKNIQIYSILKIFFDNVLQLKAY